MKLTLQMRKKCAGEVKYDGDLRNHESIEKVNRE